MSFHKLAEYRICEIRYWINDIEYDEIDGKTLLGQYRHFGGYTSIIYAIV